MMLSVTIAPTKWPGPLAAESCWAVMPLRPFPEMMFPEIVRALTLLPTELELGFLEQDSALTVPETIPL